jgi:hypothetical protein
MVPVKLGDRVKDKFSGWEGIATIQLNLFSGYRSWGVEGVDSNNQPATHDFDEPQLEVVEASTQDLTPRPSGKIRVGMKVRDIASDWEGMVVSEVLYLNGCVRYEVQGPGTKVGRFSKASPPVIKTLDESLLEPISSEKIKQPAIARSGGSRSIEPISR